MIEDIMQKIKAIIHDHEKLTAEKREALLKLIATLHEELKSLAKSNPEKAKKIADFANKVAEQAMQDDTERNPELHEMSMNDLKNAVREFEASHPNLTRVVQSICATFGV